MRVGVAYLFLTAATLRAFGADAVRECGWWSVHSGTSITGCSDLPLCKKYALKRTTPSIAADRCRYRVRALARLHLSSALRSNSEKRITKKSSLPQCIFAHLSKRRAAKKRAPYRTPPKHRTSAGAVGGAPCVVFVPTHMTF